VVSNMFFHFIYGMSSFPLTFIFFKMVKSTNQETMEDIMMGKSWRNPNVNMMVDLTIYGENMGVEPRKYGRCNGNVIYNQQSIGVAQFEGYDEDI